MNDPSRPKRGELWTIVIFAIAIRVIVFACEVGGGNISLATYTSKGDTASYIANAAVMTHARSKSSLTDYETRVFPGYPVLIATVHLLGISLSMSALLVTWICAGVAAGVAGKVYSDARVGWAMTCLVPHYLINSSLGMSEAPLLAFVCLALWASQKDRLLSAGILFAMAGMIRPMACFALGGLIFALLRDGNWKPACVVLCSAVGMFGLELLAFQLWTGDALRGVHVYAHHPDAYAGHMLEWPFQSLLQTPRHDGTSFGRIIYIWLHVLVLLLACGQSAERALRAGRSRSRDAVSFAWLVGNTAFILCIGGVWGFRHFPRFMIPAAPPLFWTLRNFFPRRQSAWILVGTVCTVVSVFGVIDSP